MNDKSAGGCPEYKSLSRRQFLAGSTAAALATLPAWMPKAAYAQGVSSPDVIVSIYLRGGADGLSLCVPHGDSGYYANTLRPTLAVPAPSSSAGNRAIDLDGFFGFIPSMQSLMPAYQNGHLLVVHATGSIDPSRSHFDAQRYMEVGSPNDPSLFTGWLGRHLISSSPVMSQSIMRGIAWDETLPLTLAGGDRALPVADINDFKLIGATQTQQARMDLLERAYLRTDNPLESAALNTLNTVTALQDINFSNYLPSGGATYPQNNGFARGLMMTAAMMKANVGLEAFHLDLGGWDTHANEGTNGGFFANHLQGLAQSLSAFYADVTAGNGIPFTLVVLSEFGRTAIENGSRGTDHGHGNAMFVMGQGIKGGRVLSKWPGLKASELYQGQDLHVTIDHRDILAEIVQKRLGNSALPFVFPGFTPTTQNIAV